MVELLLMVIIFGILALIAMPRFNYAIVRQCKAEAAAKEIVSDLCLTRRLAISDAANNNVGFELTMLGGGPYTGYEIENSDTLATVASYAIDSDVVCSGDNSFQFEPLGNLEAGGNGQLTVSAEGKVFTITIIQATGTVKCVED